VTDAHEPSRVTSAFHAGRPALVAYLMAGYPDRERSVEALHAVAAAGADVIELGVPYGDALADGPTIVRAANEAMRAAPGGFGLAEAIDVAAEFLGDQRAEDRPPVLLMTYYNPMLRAGLDVVAQRAREAGVSGFIVPDMPPEVAEEWLSVSRGLDTVFLVAPTSTPDRLELVGRISRGFVYCVSTTGVTGERDSVPAGLARTVERVRAATALPVAVGFGVSTPAQAAQVAQIADGVVVGSAIVKRQDNLAELGAFVSELAQVVHVAG